MVDYFQVIENGVFIHKGTHPDIESYSAFWDNNKIMQTKLFDAMKENKITDLYVCGLAYDVCVGNYQKVSFLIIDQFIINK